MKSFHKQHIGCNRKGYSLIEILTCIVIIALLASLMLPATVKAYRRSKSWIWGVYVFNENRINVFIDENPREEMFYTTNTPKLWSFVKYKKDGSMVMY